MNPDSDLLTRARAALEKRLSGYRLMHSFNVADTAASLAGIYGVDPLEARLAGLLHDWDKNLTDEELLVRAAEFGIDLPDEAEDMAALLHAQTGALAVAHLFPELPERVINSIARHTVASSDMTDLDMIVYIADMIEPFRTRRSIDEVRSDVGKKPLDVLFLQAYEMTMSYLLERHRFIHPDAVHVWNSLVARERHEN